MMTGQVQKGKACCEFFTFGQTDRQTGSCSVVVIRFILIESKKHHQALLDNHSVTRLPWLWTLTLLSYHRAATNATPTYPVGRFDDTGPQACIENFINGTVVFDALKENKHVLPMLLAAVHETPSCTYIADSASEVQALAYVHDSRKLWKNMPEAIEWVFRCYNTKEALQHILPACPRSSSNFELFEKIVATEPMVDPHQCSWQEQYGLIKKEACHRAFTQLDLDGSGSISAVEMKLWFQKVFISQHTFSESHWWFGRLS